MTITWLEKISRAAMMAASNQYTGTNSMFNTRQAQPKQPNMAGLRPDLPTSTPNNEKPIGTLNALGLAQNTAATLAQETITHGDHQNKANTAPMI